MSNTVNILLDTATFYGAGGGLGTLWQDFLANWLGPIFLAFVAVMAIKFLKDRQFMQLFGFVGICVIVGLLLFNGGYLFGDGGNKGKLTEIAKNAADKVGQTIIIPELLPKI